jgi:tetratricopeptide (TPR) repeat protein/uncharacterized membrane protein YhaH (DUF805 family)
MSPTTTTRPTNDCDTIPGDGVFLVRDRRNGVALTRDLAVCVVIALATIAVYGQGVTFEFVDFDDDAYVTANLHVQQGLTYRGCVWAFTTGHAANWHPLTWISHMLDWQLYGERAGGHHLTNLLLHLANSLLLFGLLRRMTDRLLPSAFVAALFALHPLHVESVAWVAERKDLLSTFFGLLSLWAYQAYVRRRDRRAYLLTGFLLALGLLAKPMLVTLPLVFILLDYWPLERRRSELGRLVLEKVPFLLLVLASSAITFLVQQSAGAVKRETVIPLGARVANGCVSYVRYLWHAVWPVDLSVLYPHPSLAGGTPWSGATVLGSALLILAITALVIAARRWRYLPVGWFWYLGMLIPVIGLVQVGGQAMADRYTYLPLVGVWVMLAWGTADSSRRTLSRRPALRGALIAVAVLYLTGMAILTHRQASFWKDSVTLYTRSLEVTPQNPILHNNLGSVLENRGDTERALVHYRQAVRLDPRSPGAQRNLAGLLTARGELEPAVRHYRTSLALEPGSAETHNGLGNALDSRGDSRSALEQYRQALEIDPDLVEARYNLARVLSNLDRAGEALTEYDIVLQVRPDHAPALVNSGNLLLARGLLGEAEQRFSRAIRSDPELAEGHNGLGVTLIRAKRPEEARLSFAAAVRLRPDWLTPMTSLAWLLATAPPGEAGDTLEAIQLAERAADLTARRDPRVLDTLAAAYASAGRYEDALAVAERAAAIADASAAAGLGAQIRRRAELYAAGAPYRRPD